MLVPSPSSSLEKPVKLNTADLVVTSFETNDDVLTSLTDPTDPTPATYCFVCPVETENCW